MPPRDVDHPVVAAKGGANSVLVYGADSRSLIDIARELDQLRSPAVIVVAGPALGNVQTIADAGWVCIGVRPFMQRPAQFGSLPADPPLPGRSVFTALTTRAEMREAWRLSSAALGGDTGPVVSDIETLAGLRVWALREDDEIISCASTVEVEGIIGVWNVATENRASDLDSAPGYCDRCTPHASTRAMSSTSCSIPRRRDLRFTNRSVTAPLSGGRPGLARVGY